MNIRDASNTLRTITGITMRDSGGTLRTIQSAWARDAAGVLRQVFSGFKVAVSPDTASGYVNSPGSFTAITSGVFGTVTGGVAPFTYAWTTPGGWSALSPGSAGTAFRSPPLSPGDESNEYGYLTVTDANLATAVSDNILLYATNIHF